MLCNFTSGVGLVSSLNLAGPFMPSRSSPRSSRMFEAMYAGSWHNHYPGETRIQLDLSGLVSFYDTELVPSLVSARSGQERWDHRLLNISREDVARVRARLREVLTRPTGQSSGVDWLAVSRVVVDRYSERLEFVRYLLDSVDTDDNDWNSITGLHPRQYYPAFDQPKDQRNGGGCAKLGSSHVQVLCYDTYRRVEG